MQDLVIYGAGGLGREVREYVARINEASPRYSLLGYVDDREELHGSELLGVEVLGGWRWLEERPGRVAVAMGLGLPRPRRSVVSRIRALVHSFPTLVDPAAVVLPSAQLGEGCVVAPGAVIASEARLGDFVLVNYNATVGHDAMVGDWSSLSPLVALSGFCRLGEGVDVGAGASLIPSAEVGAWSVVGAGAVVTSPIPERSVAVGVPASRVKVSPEP